jgi:hypothetical protein
MKKSIFVSITVAFVLCLCSSAMAAPINISAYATADNFLWVYNGSGSSWTALDLAESPGWRSSHLITKDGTSGDLYFAVQNLVNTQYPAGANNPAAFLASLTTSEGNFVETGTNTLLSDTVNWGINSDLSWGTAGPAGIDPTGISAWSTPSSYGKNSDGSTIWYANFGQISNIDPNAEWIWTANNAGAGTDNFAILKTSYSVAPVPEPATMALLGMGVLGLLGLKRKKA